MSAAVDLPLNFKDIEAAAVRIAGVAHITPVHTSTTFNSLSGRDVYFKCEIFQRGGAFKFRGAYNSVKRLGNTTNDIVTQVCPSVLLLIFM